MKIKFAIALLILAFVFGCKNDQSNPQTTSSIQLEGLTLNNNQKWVSNKETHIGMQRIDSILKHNDFKSAKKLGKSLSKQTSYIIKSCDMTGEAHDQLHVVLVPIIEEISEIKELDNTSEIDKKVRHLQRLTATYFNYFKN